ncbi:MAG TPA: winged helix-turn-helix transcriptional regulator [archaeon]|nr:winged helix-turn-helix transcriptional regulator [archaeon]
MIKKQILIFFVFITIINYNYAYNVISQDTEIFADKFDSYKISEKLIITDINSEKLELPIVPSYDVVVKINNQKYSNFSYTTELLTINLSNIPETLNIEIISLTDYYTNKNNGLWNLNYKSRYLDTSNNLKITLPKNSEIKETPISSSVQVINGQIVISFKDIKEININYDLKNVESNNYYYYLLIIPIILVGAYLLIKKKPKTKKEIKTTEKGKDLLLGLNENEQKIMKIIIENEGQSQKIITAKSFLPKGTVSRNIKKLIDKGYIDIKKYGVSNKLFLGEVFKKGENK